MKAKRFEETVSKMVYSNNLTRVDFLKLRLTTVLCVYGEEYLVGNEFIVRSMPGNKNYGIK